MPSIAPIGWGTEPSDACHKWKYELPKSPVHKLIIPNRNDDMLLEEGLPTKICTQKKGRCSIYFICILFMTLIFGWLDLNIAAKSRLL